MSFFKIIIYIIYNAKVILHLGQLQSVNAEYLCLDLSRFLKVSSSFLLLLSFPFFFLR